MLELIPKENQNDLKKEYVSRFISLAIFAVAMNALIFIALLFPSYFMLMQEKKGLIDKNEEIKKSNLYNSKLELQELAKNLDKKVTLLDIKHNHHSDIVPAILDILPVDVSLESLIFYDADKEGINVELNGNAITRDSLISFVKKIEEEKKFQEVNFPYSNLTKDRDISFNIKMKFNPNEQ